MQIVLFYRLIIWSKILDTSLLRGLFQDSEVICCFGINVIISVWYMGGEKETKALEMTYITNSPILYFQFIFWKWRLAPEIKHLIEILVGDITEDKVIWVWSSLHLPVYWENMSTPTFTRARLLWGAAFQYCLQRGCRKTSLLNYKKKPLAVLLCSKNLLLKVLNLNIFTYQLSYDLFS